MATIGVCVFCATASVVALFDPKKGNEMKANYVKPEIELILLYKSDVIATSGGIKNDIDEDLGENDGEWL